MFGLKRNNLLRDDILLFNRIKEKAPELTKLELMQAKLILISTRNKVFVYLLTYIFYAFLFYFFIMYNLHVCVPIKLGTIFAFIPSYLHIHGKKSIKEF